LDIYDTKHVLQPHTYSIEHVIPRSYFKKKLVGTEIIDDLHNLWTTDRKTNSYRSNKPLVFIPEADPGKRVFPVMENANIGALARSLLYMSDRYSPSVKLHELVVHQRYTQEKDLRLWLEDLSSRYPMEEYELKKMAWMEKKSFFTVNENL